MLNSFGLGSPFRVSPAAGIIVTGSSNVIAENRKVARIGDQFVGDFSGIIVTGDNTTKVGG